MTYAVSYIMCITLTSSMHADRVHTIDCDVSELCHLLTQGLNTSYCRYNIEILPFSIRAKGYTVYSFAVTLSLIFNQYVYVCEFMFSK